jgi:hypothetical protein
LNVKRQALRQRSVAGLMKASAIFRPVASTPAAGAMFDAAAVAANAVDAGDVGFPHRA